MRKSLWNGSVILERRLFDMEFEVVVSGEDWGFMTAGVPEVARLLQEKRFSVLGRWTLTRVRVDQLSGLQVMWKREAPKDGRVVVVLRAERVERCDEWSPRWLWWLARGVALFRGGGEFLVG